MTRSALQNAASIAALLLTTEALVADKPEKADPAAAAAAAAAMGGKGGMGGMGGMMLTRRTTSASYGGRAQCPGHRAHPGTRRPRWRYPSLPCLTPDPVLNQCRGPGICRSGARHPATGLGTPGPPRQSHALAALSYSWQVGATIETYYATAADASMSESWHDFVFGAFDPAGTISVDKLPGAL